MMKKGLFGSLCLLLTALAASAQTGAADLVSRDVCDPAANQWMEKPWMTASGSWSASDDRAPGTPEGAKAMRIEAKFGAKTFGGWGLMPVESQQEIPGRPKRIKGYARRLNDKASFEIVFRGSDDKEAKLGIPFKENNKWTAFDVAIPETLKPPVRFQGFGMNNWGSRNDPHPNTARFDLSDFRIETDVSAIPVKERPVSLGVSVPAVGNIFYKGEKPSLHVSLSSWAGVSYWLDLSVEVKSTDGNGGLRVITDVRCDDSASLTVPLPCDKPGAYTVHVSARGFPKDLERTIRYVVCLKPPELTPEQKLRSPYGLNVHGGTYVDYAAFARLGFVWLRDYAYSFEWMKRARGSGDYSGWPWPRKMERSALEHGFLTLPCLMKGILFQEKDPKSPPEPPAKWRTDMAHFICSFTNMPAFELDNEWNLKNDVMRDEYGEYHRAFGDLVKAIAPDALAVECGLAGIYPEEVRKNVQNGAFADIDVCNGHFYCGVAAPEYSKSNANTGQSEARRTYLRDLYRNWKRAAQSDGRKRQTWVTEWGWDTRAGQIVSETEQAAYLQRGYLLALANGVDKLFWYWYYDSDTDAPSHFFDGCGLYDRFREPKPAAAAFSAIRAFLPTDMRAVGYAIPAPNAQVWVYECGGKLIAAAFQVHKDGPEPVLHRQPKAEAVCDMYGAPVDGARSRVLSVAPTWYIGLDPGCDWVRQTVLDVESDWYVRNAAGEPFDITVARQGDYTVEAPDGWTCEKTERGFRVTSPANARRGSAKVVVTGTAQGVRKEIPVDVDIVPEAYVKTSAVEADGTFKAAVVNQSSGRKRQTLRAVLPAGWAMEPMERTVELDAEEKATLSFTLKASPALPADAGDYPHLAVLNEKGKEVDRAPVAPRTWTMSRVSKIQIDGDLSDWPVRNRLPGWMLGPRGMDEGTRFYIGYAEEGIYLAADVTDSKCFTSDPKSFWRAADCLEFLFQPYCDDTPHKPLTEAYHQFWFCPLAAENRAFAGFWGRVKSRPTVFDIPDVRTAVRKTGEAGSGGYRMEAFIPASRIHGYRPEKGAKVALAFTLAVQGWQNEREVYWPRGKSDDIAPRPWRWGHVTLD